MRLRNIFFIMATALSVGSCSEDFLDKKPQGKASEDVLSSADGVEALCTSAYAALAGPQGSNSTWWRPTTNWIYGEVRSETSYKGGGGINDGWEYQAFETFNGVYATNGLLDGKWFDMYCSIQRCNAALRVLNATDETTAPDRESRIGEMRALRAHYYFELSRLFNKIPYFDENVATADYINISNTEFSRDEILGKISGEFAEAAKLLPETQKEPGRFTKYAALAYQAKVTLYRAFKQNATNGLESIDEALLDDVVALTDEVITNGGYDLLADYQQLSQGEYNNSVESVLAVQYSIDDGTDLGRICWSNLLNAPKGPYSGDGFYMPSQNLVNSFETTADGVPAIDSYNTTDKMTIEDWNKTYADPRLDFTVGRLGVRWKNYEDAPYSEGWAREPATYGYYSCKKFLVSPESSYMVSGWPWGGSALNYMIIRFADVLLWKAEALIELGREAEALPLINRVRERAMNSPYVTDWTDQSKDAARYSIATYQDGVNCTWDNDFAREALRFERKLELALEGDRFFDLVRWGVADEVINDQYIAGEKDIRTYLDGRAFVPGRDEYFPVPQAQINFTGGLYSQNPGYEK